MIFISMFIEPIEPIYEGFVAQTFLDCQRSPHTAFSHSCGLSLDRPARHSRPAWEKFEIPSTSIPENADLLSDTTQRVPGR